MARKKEFQSLSQGQRDLIVQLLETQQLLSKKVTDSIKASEAELTARLSVQDDESARRHREKVYNDCKRRLLKALAFPEINERRNMIEGRVDDIGDTYKWILDNTHTEYAWSEIAESPPRQTFVNWLENGTELFWISGKPGSGKSTLMDYIYHNIQPEKAGSDLLRAWAGSHRVVVLTFWFFRPASTPLLRTLYGFWRSLCFQILDSDPNLAKIIRDDKDAMAPSSLRSCLLPDGSSAESWTDNELKEWFWYMIEHSNRRYCLLIDGLDEIEHSRELLLNTVLSISARSDKFKVCCACRPENPFQSKLKRHPNLRLQDFNRGDIEEDCKRRLKGTHAEKFADQIANRAEGVFLWAHLISENLARAAKDGEIEEDLELRLNECPDEMSELFRYMLLRQDKLYAKRPKPYLRLVDFASSIGRQTTLLELLVATLPPAHCPKWSEWSGKFEIGFLSYLEERLDGLGPRIESTCTGMVQCLAPNNYPGRPRLKSDPGFPRLDDAVITRVVFIHRSVHDFLREDEGGADHYQRFELTDDEAAKLLMAAAACPLFFSNEKLEFKSLGLSMMYYAQTVSKEGWDAKASAIMDISFKQLELRSSYTRGQRIKSPYSLSKLSTDLSLFENLSVGISSKYDLDTYVHIKILEADLTRRHAIAAYALCSYLRGSDGDRYRREMVTTLSPYVDTRQVYKFIYSRVEDVDVDVDDPRTYECSFDVESTCSLLDHVVVAGVDELGNSSSHKLDYLRLQLEFLGTHADTEPNSRFVEGWIYPSKPQVQVNYFNILPPPDDDCVFMKKVFEDKVVFVFQSRPQDIHRTNIFPLKIVRWSPAGTKRFLPINEAVQQKFRRSHSLNSWEILWDDFKAALVESLNSLENYMTEKELREIKELNSWCLLVNEDNKAPILTYRLGFGQWIYTT